MEMVQDTEDNLESEPTEPLESVSARWLAHFAELHKQGELSTAVLLELRCAMRDMLACCDTIMLGVTPLRVMEKQAILRALALSGGSTRAAAKVLGVSVRKIQYLVRDWRQAGENIPVYLKKKNEADEAHEADDAAATAA